MYTIGRHGTRADLFLSDAQLEVMGASVHSVDRGGQMTWHGPGQSTVYAILNLRPHRRIRRSSTPGRHDGRRLHGRGGGRRGRRRAGDWRLSRRTQARQRGHSRAARHHDPRNRAQSRPRPRVVRPDDRLRRARRTGDLDRRRGRRSRPGAGRGGDCRRHDRSIRPGGRHVHARRSPRHGRDRRSGGRPAAVR